MKRLSSLIILLGLFISVQAEGKIGGLPSPSSLNNNYKPLSGNSLLKKRWGPEITIGGMAGLNISRIKGADDNDAKMILSPNFGAIVRFQNTPGMAFETGILYSAKGYKNKSDLPINPTTTIHEDFKVNLNYIDIPILLRISFHENFVFNIDLGGYAAFLLSAKKEGSSTTEYSNIMEDPINYDNADVKDSFHTFDFGLHLGGGVQKQITDKRRGVNMSLFAKAGWQIGLRTVSSIDQADFNNRTYQVNVGVLFHLDQ